jgi:predicted Zn finger-like uncharacterized protein
MTMEILCPECQFSREVDETKIPPRSQVATCPKCKTKFKFRELPEEEFALEEQADVPAPEPNHSASAHAPKNLEPPTPDQVEPSFPGLPHDGEPEQGETDAYDPDEIEEQDPRDALWSRLDKMRPPAADQSKRAPEPRVEPDDESDEEPSYGANPIPGWTGEFNEDFPDPMGPDGDHPGDDVSPLVPPPFEQLDRYGFFQGLIMTVRLVLRSPRLFFSVMPVGGGLAKPLTFAILLTMIQSLFQYGWEIMGLSTSIGSGGAPSGTTGTVGGLMMLLFMPAFIAAGQFAVTGVYHLLLVLMRADKQGFEGTFRALAYANAPLALGIFPMPVIEIEIAWMLLAAVWGLFLTIVGLKHIHRTSYAKVIPVALVPLLLAMIGGFLVYHNQLATI